jgi:hypothetical protein
LRRIIASGGQGSYKAAAMKLFHPGEWCFDPYAKQCERCDTVIGRYAVMLDEDGFRQVLFFPHKAWDGVDGSFRCRAHTRAAHHWLRLA